ncbi:MAG: hypothetical protein CSA65_01105 [Proteobacteria bacterium]|nr:MAG: hypothetical protein CSA65_01105 [Pseudomonadota bacterium]
MKRSLFKLGKRSLLGLLLCALLSPAGCMLLAAGLVESDSKNRARAARKERERQRRCRAICAAQGLHLPENSAGSSVTSSGCSLGATHHNLVTVERSSPRWFAAAGSGSGSPRSARGGLLQGERVAALRTTHISAAGLTSKAAGRADWARFGHS